MPFQNTVEKWITLSTLFLLKLSINKLLHVNSTILNLYIPIKLIKIMLIVVLLDIVYKNFFLLNSTGIFFHQFHSYRILVLHVARNFLQFYWSINQSASLLNIWSTFFTLMMIPWMQPELVCCKLNRFGETELFYLLRIKLYVKYNLYFFRETFILFNPVYFKSF